MKSKYLVMLALSIVSAPAHAGSVLVTDIDDTIRRTNVPDVVHTVYHGFAGAPAFAGMAILYKAMVPNKDFVALSGAPKEIKNRVPNWIPYLKRLNKKPAKMVQEFLDQYGFEPYLVLLKSKLSKNTADHKLKSLLDLAEKQRQENFILIGDDTEKDPEVYDAFRKKHPNRVTEIYIRVVVNRAIPKGIKKFNSALDVAEAEYLAGRLTLKDYQSVGIDLLAADEEAFIPEYAWCRREYKTSDALTNPGAYSMRRAVNDRMFKICSKRWRNLGMRKYNFWTLDQKDLP